MKTTAIFTIFAVFMMAMSLSSCTTSKMLVHTDGHNVLTREIMENPEFNNPEKLAKIQWYSGDKEIILVRSYETSTDTVIDGRYVTSVINIDTVRILPFTAGVLVSPSEVGVAFEDSSAYLIFTPNEEGNYAFPVDRNIRYGEYDWQIISGGNAYLLFDLVKSEEVKTGRIVAGMQVSSPPEE